MTEFSSPSLLRRLAAMVYDSLIVLAIGMGYWALVLALEITLFGGSVAPGEKAEVSSWWLLGLVLAIAAFNISFWRKAGQTVGMRAWRLQVVSNNSTTDNLLPPSLQQCVVRFITACLSLTLGGIGYLWSLVDQEGKTLHDRASSTRVVLLAKAKSEKNKT